MSDLSPMRSSRDGVTIVEFGPGYKNLDEGKLPTVQSFLEETAAQINPPKLALDLSHTQFFGSAFIEVMVRIWNHLKERNGRFAICGLQTYCKEILEVAQLDSVWEIYPDQDTAVERLKSDETEP